MDQKFKEEIKTKIALPLLGNTIFVKKSLQLDVHDACGHLDNSSVFHTKTLLRLPASVY